MLSQDIFSSFLWRKVPRKILQDQARKRDPNPNFLVRISSGGVAVFHVKGWGPKSSVCPSKPRETKFFGGISRDFAGIPGIFRGYPEKFEKNICVQFWAPTCRRIPGKSSQIYTTKIPETFLQTDQAEIFDTFFEDFCTAPSSWPPCGGSDSHECWTHPQAL